MMPKRPPMQPIQDMKFGGGIPVVVTFMLRSRASAADWAVPTSVIWGMEGPVDGEDGDGTRLIVAAPSWAPIGSPWDCSPSNIGGREAAVAGDTRLHAWMRTQGLKRSIFKSSCSVGWSDGAVTQGVPYESGGYIDNHWKQQIQRYK